MATLARLAEAEAEAEARPAARAGLDAGLARARGGPAGRCPARRLVLPLGRRSGSGPGSTRPSRDPHGALRPGRALRRTGDTGESADLLEPVLDRTLLAHGYPALGEAHPLLARARALAARLGMAVPGTVTADLDEASLDIDV